MRSNRTLALLIAALAAAGCSKGSSPTSPPPIASLGISPDTLTVTNSTPSGTASVTTNSSAGLDWHVAAKPAWTIISPTSGSATQVGQTITVTANTTGLAYGDHWGSVVLAAASDTVMLAVRLQYPAPPLFHFEETFDGPLDATVWWTDDLISRNRWCDANAGSTSGPGQWLDPSVDSCHGVMQSVPYGSATLSVGALQCSSVGSMRTFPLLASRYPGTVAVFPAAEDFRFTVRMRFDTRTAWGTGVAVVKVVSTEPTGTQYPWSGADVVFHIWADPNIGVYSAVSGTYQSLPATITTPDAYHEYSFAYSAGAYVFSLDGTQVYGPIASTMRPTAIIIGNAVFSFWGATSWTGFTIDDVRVDGIAATP